MDEQSEMMLERMHMLEEALQRAETGVAEDGDWNIIRYECGRPKPQFITLEAISISRSEV